MSNRFTAIARTTWTTQSALTSDGDGYVNSPAQRDCGRADRLLTTAGWPVTFILIVHTVFVQAANGHVTDDFTTVYQAVRRFLDGVPVYNEIYHYVDPHYLYNPGATLALTPMAILGSSALARMLFVCVNAAAIIAALALMCRLFGFRWSSGIVPVTIALAFLTEAVQNTLIFGNINGLMLLFIVLFLTTLLSGRTVWAGVLLGLAILIKPLFAPLVVLLIMRGHWAGTFAAVIVPFGANVIAYPLVPGAQDYFDIVVPYLGITRDYANGSLAGMAVYLGMPQWAHAFMFCLIAIIVVIALISLARFRLVDGLLWATSTTGVLLVGVFFLSSLGQQYYSMFAFPLLFTVFQARSIMHSWLAWLAVVLFYAPLSWNSVHWVTLMRWWEYFSATTGWALLLVVAAGVSLGWAISDLKQSPTPNQKKGPFDGRFSEYQRSRMERTPDCS
ncbi:glycosyltransferase family 87 protein [Corynebacterium renale]|uniref:Arabinofuranan 3-O-arabinosyltransferase n=1 Tax=Corynebacterium renale TaxID=1724 RepID=A0A2A9DQF4_9CORY|nr:glycosyltransferase family 87 protein [Corynebacterium renale]PFG28596.1 arabinofuranan 3-O-arabinosyltransferase [Corynebacterium renale]SQI26168.1 hypothetical membrane protein [Corynebacterium renale]